MNRAYGGLPNDRDAQAGAIEAMTETQEGLVFSVEVTSNLPCRAISFYPSGDTVFATPNNAAAQKYSVWVFPPASL